MKEDNLPLDQIVCGDNCEVMRLMPSESIDLVVTSPPYDDLRTYGGHSWDFYGVAWNLKRLLKPGGVIVWVVADQTKDGSETGSSFVQAMHFKSIGLNLHDTMLYMSNKPPLTHRRYEQSWEYCFILTKGKPATFCPLMRKTSTAGSLPGRFIQNASDAAYSEAHKKERTGDETYRPNAWYYHAGKDRSNGAHPAPFPEALARDHILSWSNSGEVVLDPFSGSGTTAKMARETGRRFIGVEVNQEYVDLSQKRLEQQVIPLETVGK